MTQEEGNKLIAEFMGFTQLANTSAFVKGDSLRLILSYHDSWGYIMPVIERIMPIISNHTETITINETIYYLSFYNKEPIKNISDLWLAVIQFIQWYNTTKK